MILLLTVLLPTYAGLSEIGFLEWYLSNRIEERAVFGGEQSFDKVYLQRM
jgi:hypothetical protein